MLRNQLRCPIVYFVNFRTRWHVQRTVDLLSSVPKGIELQCSRRRLLAGAYLRVDACMRMGLIQVSVTRYFTISDRAAGARAYSFL